MRIGKAPLPMDTPIREQSHQHGVSFVDRSKGIETALEALYRFEFEQIEDDTQSSEDGCLSCS